MTGSQYSSYEDVLLADLGKIWQTLQTMRLLSVWPMPGVRDDGGEVGRRGKERRGFAQEKQ